MNLYDAVETLNLRWPASGKLPCPLHVDKTASLHLYANTNSWTCFSCQETGDSYGLIAAFTGKSLAQVFGMYKPKLGHEATKMTTELVGPHALNQRVKRAWSELNRLIYGRVATIFSEFDEHTYLWEIEHIGEYLDAVRERITSTGMYADEPLPPLRTVRGVLDDIGDFLDLYLDEAEAQLADGTYDEQRKTGRYIRNGS